MSARFSAAFQARIEAARAALTALAGSVPDATPAGRRRQRGAARRLLRDVVRHAGAERVGAGAACVREVRTAFRWAAQALVVRWR